MTIDEQSLQPYKFYKELCDKGDTTSWLHKLNTEYHGTYGASDKLKNLAAQLVKNYTETAKNYEELNDKTRCIYLNYWLDLETKSYKVEENIPQFDTNVDVYINSIWQKLQQKNNLCERKENHYSYDEMKIRKELFDFCENRNILRNSNTHISCAHLNDWVRQKYDTYFSKENCPKYNKMVQFLAKNESPFHISDTCSFYHIRNTFYDFHCGYKKDTHTYNYIYKYKIDSINNCEHNTMSDGNRLKTFRNEPTTGKSVSTTMLSLGLTPFIICIFFFILYKFSPFGAYFQNNIINKYILRKNINEEAGELLHDVSHRIHSNYQIGNHYIAYQSP
ncbi:PIR Superfamily Protein [Plasmodium ovale wallikeri]|uniref:PIR protein n=2 Tax=Plasmodium ovale TaxID=36330 RepID=A0A1C3KH48_PLAOA|nr:PIR Superfamily Protein [Plasmodium ovale wallikeri]SBT73055.1 PIR protein [Plasmodium ovale]